MNTQIDYVRSRIAAAKAERAALQSQPRSRHDVRAAVTAVVEEMAADARGRIAWALRRVAAGDSPRDAVNATFGQCGPTTVARAVDAVGLVAFMGQQAVSDALLAPLDDTVPEGVTDSARALRVAEFDADIERWEREEEALIVESEKAGTPIPRRDDASIEAILASTAPAAPKRRAPVPDEVEADAVEHMTKRARERLRPASAASEYLKRRED